MIDPNNLEWHKIARRIYAIDRDGNVIFEAFFSKDFPDVADWVIRWAVEQTIRKA